MTTADQIELFINRGRRAQVAVDETIHMSRSTDPESSKAAARKHANSFCHGSHKQMLYDAIRRQPGLTAGQYNDLLGWRYATAGKRVNELRDLGLIRPKDNGTKPLTWFPVGV